MVPHVKGNCLPMKFLKGRVIRMIDENTFPSLLVMNSLSSKNKEIEKIGLKEGTVVETHDHAISWIMFSGSLRDPTTFLEVRPSY